MTDIIFVVAIADTPIDVEETLVICRQDSSREIEVPILHYTIPDDLPELQDIQQILHERIDSIFASVIAQKAPRLKKTVKVFNCFGQTPEIVEIEVDDTGGGD